MKASGGEPEPITRVEGTAGRRQIVRASFGPEGRIFFPEQKEERPATPGQGGGQQVTHLVSVRPDGSDRRTHLIFEYSDELVPSPDGKWVAFDEGDNIYLTPLPLEGTGTTPVKMDKRKGKLPVTQVSKEGGLFPRWRDNDTIEFGSGPRHFIYHVDTKKTDETAISLSIPRRIPKGSIALTNARIVTLENKQVIESGTIVVIERPDRVRGAVLHVRHRARSSTRKERRSSPASSTCTRTTTASTPGSCRHAARRRPSTSPTA